MTIGHPRRRTLSVYTPGGSPPYDATLAPSRAVLGALFGPPAERDFAVRYWTGTVEGPGGAPRFTVVLRGPGALRRMLLPPSELALVEAYIFGDIDIEGDLEAAASLGDTAARQLSSGAALVRAARLALALPRGAGAGADAGSGGARRARGLARFGRRHSMHRDGAAVRFHYDLGNAFYARWLDERMVYSCAYFRTGDETLDDAQVAKLDLVCRKLRLRPGERMLDIGCGWGALVIHAAKEYGAHALGVTLSERQAALARERIASAGVADRCRVEVLDYRAIEGEGRFDKIASVGMVEHVGRDRLDEYFGAAFRLLAPGGLFLNHGIVSLGRARPRPRLDWLWHRLWRRDAFIHRYVFPDATLVPAAPVLAAAERAGFETRDVESLREHYALTLRHWVRRLQAGREAAVREVGEATYRVWRLYMAASAHSFASGRNAILQTLLAKPDAAGRSAVPLTREDLY